MMTGNDEQMVNIAGMQRCSKTMQSIGRAPFARPGMNTSAEFD
jgi:hypothetical protein